MCPGPQELMSSHQTYSWLQEGWVLVATASVNVEAMAFNDDLVRRVDDENTTVVHDNSTGKAAGLAC